MHVSPLSKYNGVYVHDASTRKVWGDSFIFIIVHTWRLDALLSVKGLKPSSAGRPSRTGPQTSYIPTMSSFRYCQLCCIGVELMTQPL